MRSHLSRELLQRNHRGENKLSFEMVLCENAMLTRFNPDNRLCDCGHPRKLHSRGLSGHLICMFQHPVTNEPCQCYDFTITVTATVSTEHLAPVDGGRYCEQSGEGTGTVHNCGHAGAKRKGGVPGRRASPSPDYLSRWIIGTSYLYVTPAGELRFQVFACVVLGRGRLRFDCSAHARRVPSSTTSVTSPANCGPAVPDSFF
jgi:hypothetical protein